MNESFILQVYLDDVSVCDAVIAAHEASPNKVPGRMYTNGELVVNKAVKDSEDSLIYGDSGLAYVKQLQGVADAYIAKYPQCNMYDGWGLREDPQVQKYKPNGGYFPWHCERSSAGPEVVSSRHLAFLTYLNDVTDAGETEFMLQNLKVQPRKGLTLIWPADWTHTHRGVASPTQEKYLITGWFNYL